MLDKRLGFLNSFHRQQKAKGISDNSEKILFLSSLTIHLFLTESVKKYMEKYIFE